VKAVVLVGGEGTRLRPLTETIPKPLLPFMNRPFFGHVLDHLAAHGVEEVICSSPYLEGAFLRFLEAQGEGPRVTWIEEAEPLGTAGAVVGALGRVDGTFLVLNGDVLTDMDLGELVRVHRDRAAVATIALTPVEDARPFGLVETAPDGRVLAFREKPAEPVAGTINAGTYVLEPRALERAPTGVMVSIERETYPDLIARGEPVYAHVAGGYWRDVGTPEAYLAAHLDALGGRVGGRRYPRPTLAEGTRVDPAADVGPLVVAGPGVSVGPGARLGRSVLHRGVEVGEGSVVDGSVLGPSVRVGAGASVRDSVLGEGASVPRGASLEGARVSAGASRGT
jgi:mannose-1-phosphate guanylyltransferase